MDSQGRALLDHVYNAFSLRSDDLFDAVSQPGAVSETSGLAERWTDLGDWLGLAERLGAEKVLFVRDDPVAVFSDARAAPDEAALGELYRRAWCLSEPRCLFVALPHELRIYDLNLPPERGRPPGDPWRVLSTAADVLTLTQEIDEYGPSLQGLMEVGNHTPARADRRLIGDLRHVRAQLERTGLSMAEAHALIGRSILVRYLEDRGVLTLAYFQQVAQGNPAWEQALAFEGPVPVLGPAGKQRLYDRVLCSAEFTHALFVRLAEDFNGDLFALGEARDKRFSEAALQLLRSFLLGEIQAAEQAPLFFWAYDFEVVPLSLISSIYEQFYHDALDEEKTRNSQRAAGKRRGNDPETDASVPGAEHQVTGELQHGAGTHYTPANLVHDALRRTLTPARLSRAPKILDPACGSGIFLVEAFRRIVRYEAQIRRRKLSPDELREILRHRVCGIEINAEAARVAAFSLYLALLDQQEPPDIASGGPLPYLLHNGARDETHFGILMVSDAFALTCDERQALSKRVAAKKAYKGRAVDVGLLAKSGALELPLASFDVIVGNPPWQETVDGSVPRIWARAFNLPAGEGSYSQLFIHRALSLLRDGGTLGLLIGMKVFWNDRDTSREFRSYFLKRAAIRQVVNMAHVRRVFFTNAVAPFAFLLAEKRRPAPGDRVEFWNARRVGRVERLRSMVAVPLDRRVVAQSDLMEADYLWKLFWWGSHHDAALVARLGLERTVGDTVKNADPQPGYGWQRGTSPPTGSLAMLRELDNKRVEPFGPLQEGWFLSPPKGIKRDPDQRIYEGQRLVITRGVKEPMGPIARLETSAFSYRHTVYGIPLRHLSLDQAKLVLGVMWSSLGRYLLFMTAGNWGGWHDQVTSRDILRVPVRLKPSWGMSKSDHDDAAGRIVAAVEQLKEHSWQPTARRPLLETLDNNRASHDVWIEQLDTATFDLFETSQAERDLVADFWAENHELYWKGPGAEAVRRIDLRELTSGVPADLPDAPGRGEMSRYLSAFLDAWAAYLPKSAELYWQVASSPSRDAIAVVISLDTPRERTLVRVEGEEVDWQSILERCAKALSRPISPAFFVKRTVRAATGNSFIVVRENARRFWTASTAREDAEALFVQLASRRES